MHGNGIDVEVLTGDIDQKKRLKIIDKMKDGSLRVLVATDVAARGLHVDDISHVINYDLPADAANYVHRIGRTARAGASGVAHTLACEDLVVNLPPIERYIEQKIEVAPIDFELEKDQAGRYQRKRGGQFGDRPQGGRSQGGRPQGGRPQGGRPYGDRPQGDRPQGRPQGDRPPQGRPDRGDSPRHAERSRDERPSAGGDSRRRPHPARGQDGFKSGTPKPSKQMTSEDRMALYRNKYGDSFGGKGPDASTGEPRKHSAPRPKGHVTAAKPHHARPKGEPVKHAKPAAKAHAPGKHEKHEKHDKHDKHENKEPKKSGILRKILGVFKKK